MPIRFRCSYCNRLLGIATRKAGMDTTCPHCGYTITVPVPQEDDGRTERMNLEDVEAALGRGATEVIQPAALAAPAVPMSLPPSEPPRAEVPKPAAYPKPAAAPPPPAPKPRPAPPKPPIDPNDPPLFEKDMDEILGKTVAPVEAERDKPAKVSGMDAMSLGEPARHLVISAQKATFLMILVVVLLVLAFAAGYFLAPK
jgi:phage FluMu protein Com